MPSRGGLGSGAAWGGSAVPALAGLDGRFVETASTLPFASLVFVLLVIMFTITPTTVCYRCGLEPRALTGEVVPKVREVLFIEEGHFYVGGQERSGSVLAAAIAPMVGGAERTLYLSAEEETPYGRVLDALSAARTAGARNVELLVRRPYHAPMLASVDGTVRWAERTGCEPWVARRPRKECR